MSDELRDNRRTHSPIGGRSRKGVDKKLDNRKQCLALHVDPDAANKCDHSLGAEIEKASIEWAVLRKSANPAMLIASVLAQMLPRRRA